HEAVERRALRADAGGRAGRGAARGQPEPRRQVAAVAPAAGGARGHACPRRARPRRREPPRLRLRLVRVLRLVPGGGEGAAQGGRRARAEDGEARPRRGPEAAPPADAVRDLGALRRARSRRAGRAGAGAGGGRRARRPGERGRVRASAGRRALVGRLARAARGEGTPEGSALVGALPDVGLRLPLPGQVDVAAYSARQRKRLEQARADAERSRRKLANAGFVKGAPAEVVAEERRRLEEAEALAARLERVLADIA